MDGLYRKYAPEDVIPFYLKRDLTEQEIEHGWQLNKYGNVQTTNEFLDVFAGLVRKLRWATLDDYAAHLDIPPNDLNATVRVLSGKTVREWVVYYVLLATNELLRNTNKNVDAISKELGFSQASIFSRFCKQRLKKYPTDLRWRMKLAGKGL